MIGGDLLLLAVAGLASAVSWSTIYTGFNALMIVATVSVVAVLTVLRKALVPPHRLTIVAAVAITLIPQIWRPPNGNVVKTALFPWAIGIGVVASLLLILAAAGPARWRVRLAVGSMVTMAASCIALIIASPIAEVDVWVIFQQATTGLLHGLNPYEQYFTGVPAGQTADCFNYLPATFLIAAPTRWFLGDVRYGEFAVLAVGYAALAVVTWRRARSAALAQPATVANGSNPAATAGLMMILFAAAFVLPGTLRVVHQAWNESIVLGCLLVCAALLVTRRANWAIIPLAIALATKQHVALVLPLFALWPQFGWRRTLIAIGGAVTIALPWVLANFGRFYQCTVDFFIELPARTDSLSLWRFIPQDLQTVAVLVLLAAGYVLVYLRVERSITGLVFGCAVVMMAFDIANKQSFENQWWLAAALVVVALGLRSAPALDPASRERN